MARAYYKVGDGEYTIHPMTREDFVEAFCTEVDGEIVSMKAFTGYPSFYVPGTKLLWPIPPDGLEIHYEED